MVLKKLNENVFHFGICAACLLMLFAFAKVHLAIIKAEASIVNLHSVLLTEQNQLDSVTFAFLSSQPDSSIADSISAFSNLKEKAKTPVVSVKVDRQYTNKLNSNTVQLDVPKKADSTIVPTDPIATTDMIYDFAGDYNEVLPITKIESITNIHLVLKVILSNGTATDQVVINSITAPVLTMQEKDRYPIEHLTTIRFKLLQAQYRGNRLYFTFQEIYLSHKQSDLDPLEDNDARTVVFKGAVGNDKKITGEISWKDASDDVDSPTLSIKLPLALNIQ